MSKREKVLSKIVGAINKENLDLSNIVKVGILDFNSEYMVIVKTKEKDIILNGLSYQLECEMCKMFLDTMVKLSNEQDCPESFKALEIDNGFVDTVLKEVILNTLVTQGQHVNDKLNK